MKKIDELSVAAIRSLCIDMINKANSGHPGMALGSAPILYTLFTRHLNVDVNDMRFVNRDRFVLSAGHASSLLYSMLHLSGYKLSLDDLKNFRQIDSLTPGHPEYLFTDGVDATSGPLGQGIASAVGIAMAEAALQANFPEGEKLYNHYTYVLCGDGCLQEGLSQEAISLAGHQRLNKLILFYDSNAVTLDGGLELSFSEDVKTRFVACEWAVLEVKDGNDIDAIDDAIKHAKCADRPTLIIVHTTIGYGSAKQGTSKTHGSPLGVEDGKHAKVDVYGFDHEDFYVPEEVYENFRNTIGARGKEYRRSYENTLEEYKEKYPEEFARYLKQSGSLSVDEYLQDPIPEAEVGAQVSTRNASGKALNAMMDKLPNLYGGSADVASSVVTKLNNGVNFDRNHREGHNINWGIREFEMACAQNGMLLHGGLRTYVGCFLVFSDYMKAAIRMAALSHLPAIYLFSHDSIAVGEDGPTHQPIEQLAMLRSIPHVRVLRPCDEKETFSAWKEALRSVDKPTCIILSRQNLPILEGTNEEGFIKGAYVVSEASGKNEVDLIASGSEVSLAVEAQAKLKELGVSARVISMPSWELFDKQSEEYKASILDMPYERRVSVEMLSTFGWAKYAKTNMGLDNFGASAPAKDVIKKFDFNSDHLVKLVLKVLDK